MAAALLVMLAGCATGERMLGRDWFTAWAMSHNARETTPAMSGRTVRMLLTPSVSGDALRVKLENTMGEAPVAFTSAYIGVAGSGAAVDAHTITPLLFNGRPGLTLAPGQGAYSDPVPFAVQAFRKLALSLVVQSAADISMHHVGLRVNWSAPGARGADPSATGFEPLPEAAAIGTGQWPYYWVSALDVRSPGTTGTIALLADSITDGRCSTRDAKGVVQPDLDQRWPDVFAPRLAAAGIRKSIANLGISGNRLLGRGNGPSGFERLERDALDRAGLTDVVLFLGTNDLANNFTAEQVIAGMRQIAALIRSRGARVIGVTIVPRGRPAPTPGWTSANEKARLTVNDWIRTKAGFDGVIDFDALMKGGPMVKLVDGGMAPAMPDAWNCDGTHPNAAGYRAMGEFVDPKIFEKR